MDTASILKNVDLTNYSTFRNRFCGDLAIVKDLEQLIAWVKGTNGPYRVLGGGSNILFYKFLGPYLKLQFPYGGSGLTLPASIPLAKIVSLGMANRWGGVQIFTGIPGTLGGAVAMNAGISIGETKDLIREVEIVTSEGIVKKYLPNLHSFSYRKNHFLAAGDIVYQATIAVKDFDIRESVRALQLERNQLKINTLGSTFKNRGEIPAGKLIAESGLKGKTIGGVRVSYQHANFLENFNNGSAEDAIRLIELIREKVYLDHKIELELEIKIY
jgi:UDP-N-acetylmuramate dehydrogenase